MTDQQSITPERAADLLAAFVPCVARVEMYPQWSDGTGETVRRTRAIPYDAEGNVIDLLTVERRYVSGLLRRLDGVDMDRPQTLDVAGRTVTPTLPVVACLPVALWESPVAVDPYRLAQLVAQRHEPEDAAEPPLAVAAPDPARDCARSLADGLMTPPDGDDPAPTRQVQEDVALLLGLPGPTAPERPVEDVPVQGGAL